MNQVEKNRLKQLIYNVPDIFKSKNNCLYIGAHKKRFHFSEKLKEYKIKTDVVEIDIENIEFLRSQKWLNNIYHSDIRVFKTSQTYDLILWSHGPEMLPEKDIIPTIKYLESITNKLIVLMVPFGKYSYKNIPSNNKYNQTTLYPDFFTCLNYQTDTLGKKDTNGSNLLAWKYI